MNVFQIHQSYRTIGISYGLPVYYVDFGAGVSIEPVDVAKRLLVLGLEKGGWVVLRNNPVAERGCGVLVSGLKKLDCKVEVEDEGKNGAPGWFPQADRWMIWYSKSSKFNYGALRPRQDMLVYKGEDILGFLADTEGEHALRAIVVKDPKEVWDLVKGKDVRVYAE